MEEWIEEFLFRGKPPSGPGSEQAPAFHLMIGQQAPSPLDPAEKVRKVIGPLTAAQAEAAGWTLDRIVAGVNSEALKRITELEMEITRLSEAAVDTTSQVG